MVFCVQIRPKLNKIFMYLITVLPAGNDNGIFAPVGFKNVEYLNSSGSTKIRTVGMLVSLLYSNEETKGTLWTKCQRICRILIE